MYAAQARNYIEKLIRLQQKIEEKGYRRIDQGTVVQARRLLKNQLEAYPYNTDDKMRGFWERHNDEIRVLIPAESHRCFKKLMNEFITLKSILTQ
jgi:hypothetical protein